jgi:hypothetical protein
MITIDYHPLVEAVVDAWKSQLPRAEPPLRVSEADLRELVARLSRAIDVLARCCGPEELELRIRNEVNARGVPEVQ